MRESRSSSETKFQLTTVDNPDLPEIDKPVLTFKGRPENGKSYQQTNSAIVTAWLGIILAGGLCPCLILIFGFAVRLTRSGLPSSYAGQFLFSWLETVFLSTIIGMLLVAFCCAFSSAVIVLLNWSMGGVFGPRTAVSLTGGLAGYLATTPMSIWIHLNELPVAGLVFGLVAMAVGQLSGILAVWKLEPQLLAPAVSPAPQYQFQIRHLLVATAWFAAIAAIDGISRRHLFMMIFGVWLVFQAALLVADRCWLVCWSKLTSNRLSSAKTSL